MNPSVDLYHKAKNLDEYLSQRKFADFFAELEGLGEALETISDSSYEVFIPNVDFVANSAKYQKIIEAYQVFRRIWKAKELNHVQDEAIDGEVPCEKASRYYNKQRELGLAADQIEDQRSFAAHCYLNRAIKKKIEAALRYTERYYALLQAELKKQAEEKYYEEEKTKAFQKKTEETFQLTQAMSSQVWEAYLWELDEALFTKIENHRNTKQKLLSGVGIFSGLFASVIFGFIEGGSAMLALLSGFGTALLTAKIIANFWGIGLGIMQWKTMRSGTNKYLLAAHGKDNFAEGFVRYHDARGFHELDDWNKCKLAIGTFFFACAGLAMGALAHKSLLDLSILLSVGFSFAIPPVAMSYLVISVMVIIGINASYMYAHGYANLLKSKKTLYQYLTDPFWDTYTTIRDDPTIQYKKCAIGGAIAVFCLAYIAGIGGLIIAGITASHSMAAISDSVLHSGPTVAKWLGIAICDIVVNIGRLVFSIDRANLTAQQFVPVKEKDKMKISPSMRAAAMVGGIQTGLFYNKEHPFPKAWANEFGATMTGLRDYEGFSGGGMQQVVNHRRECDFFAMKTAPTIPMLNSLPGANAAYVRVQGEGGGFELYYINKANRQCDLISLTAPEKVRFDNESKSQLDAAQRQNQLSHREHNHLRAVLGLQSVREVRTTSILYARSMDEITQQTVAALVMTQEAYVRIHTQEEDKIYYFNASTGYYTLVTDEQATIKRFDQSYGKQIKKNLEAQALTANTVKQFTRVTGRFFHATSQADEFRAYRVRQQMQHGLFSPSKKTANNPNDSGYPPPLVNRSLE